ncbi:hypothetical protein C8R45DRAFT_937202 [Mycena sanguinolenta]|nr:hypothetical protein C8R45DRAFT_937202 [Mycena sanguinolenta]
MPDRRERSKRVVRTCVKLLGSLSLSRVPRSTRRWINWIITRVRIVFSCLGSWVAQEHLGLEFDSKTRTQSLWILEFEHVPLSAGTCKSKGSCPNHPNSFRLGEYSGNRLPDSVEISELPVALLGRRRADQSRKEQREDERVRLIRVINRARAEFMSSGCPGSERHERCKPAVRTCVKLLGTLHLWRDSLFDSGLDDYEVGVMFCVGFGVAKERRGRRLGSKFNGLDDAWNFIHCRDRSIGYSPTAGVWVCVGIFRPPVGRLDHRSAAEEPERVESRRKNIRGRTCAVSSSSHRIAQEKSKNAQTDECGAGIRVVSTASNYWTKGARKSREKSSRVLRGPESRIWQGFGPLKPRENWSKSQDFSLELNIREPIEKLALQWAVK